MRPARIIAGTGTDTVTANGGGVGFGVTVDLSRRIDENHPITNGNNGLVPEDAPIFQAEANPPGLSAMPFKSLNGADLQVMGTMRVFRGTLS